jgi:hypothetical protein
MSVLTARISVKSRAVRVDSLATSGGRLGN